MIDVKQGVRTAFFNALNGNLTYQATPVPISDEVEVTGNAALYVLIGYQSGVQKNTFDGFASEESLVLDIISKTTDLGAKEPLDQVAGQILAIICPSRPINGLGRQGGIQIINVRLDDDRYLSLSLNASNTMVRRLLTFKMYVSQT